MTMGVHSVPRFLLLILATGLKVPLKVMVAERYRSPLLRPVGRVPRLIVLVQLGFTGGWLVPFEVLAAARCTLPARHAAYNTLRKFSPYRLRAWAKSSKAAGDGLRPAPFLRSRNPRATKIRLKTLAICGLEKSASSAQATSVFRGTPSSIKSLTTFCSVAALSARTPKHCRYFSLSICELKCFL